MVELPQIAEQGQLESSPSPALTSNKRATPKISIKSKGIVKGKCSSNYSFKSAVQSPKSDISLKSPKSIKSETSPLPAAVDEIPT